MVFLQNDLIKLQLPEGDELEGLEDCPLERKVTGGSQAGLQERLFLIPKVPPLPMLPSPRV